MKSYARPTCIWYHNIFSQLGCFLRAFLFRLKVPRIHHAHQILMPDPNVNRPQCLLGSRSVYVIVIGWNSILWSSQKPINLHRRTESWKRAELLTWKSPARGVGTTKVYAEKYTNALLDTAWCHNDQSILTFATIVWKLFKIETPLTWLNLIRIFPH